MEGLEMASKDVFGEFCLWEERGLAWGPGLKRVLAVAFGFGSLDSGGRRLIDKETDGSGMGAWIGFGLGLGVGRGSDGWMDGSVVLVVLVVCLVLGRVQ